MQRSTMGRAALALISTLLCGAQFALAQSYPAKPIRLVVPFPPGGGMDVLARSFGPGLTAALGQPVVIDNRPSAGGVVGAETVARSAPDGYTLGVSGSFHTVGSLLYRKLPYQIERDFTPITMIGDSDVQLYVKADLPIRTLAELIAYAKANPGKLNYGSGGVGHPYHLSMEMFQNRAGISLFHVPYKGMNPVIQDFFGGRLDAMFYSASAQFRDQIAAGKIRAIGTSADKRHPRFPESATFDEQGVKDFRPASHIGIIGPAGMPRVIVERLTAEFSKVTLSPEVVAAYDNLQFVRMQLGPDEYATFIRKEMATWAPLVKSLNIALD